MLSKTKIAYIRSLHNKATRLEEGVFLVEWRKCMGEFLDSDFEIVEGLFSAAFLSSLSLRHVVEGSLSKSSYENKDIIISKWQEKGMSTTWQKIPFPHTIVTENELSRITTLTSNDSGILLVRMKNNYLLCHPDAGRICSEKISWIKQIPRASEWQKKDELVLILDTINDPGNLGTIIRIADWYGISQIICSPDTVDCYNPKVLMATMGSFTRVSIFYTDLEEYLSLVSQVSRAPLIRGVGGLASKNPKNPSALSGTSPWQGSIRIYGAYLDGESVHTKDFSTRWGYLVIGGEAHGISDSLEKYITDKITIPRFGLAESLNAGVATAVILDRMRG